MNLDDPRFLWWLQAAAYAAFAALGGFMGNLMRTIDQDQRVYWPRAILEGASSAFVGFIVMLICQAMHLGQEWTGVVVGVSGWLGASVSIKVLETLVRRKLGLDPRKEPPSV